MNAQLLLKLLAAASLAATAAAVVIWRQTGSAPPTWLIQLSVAAFGAAMLVGLIGAETRPRIMLRFLAALSALVAAIALVSDLTHNSGFTPFLRHMKEFVPSLVASLSTRVAALFGPDAWDPMLTTILSVPTFFLFAVLAALCGYVSRRREKLQIFVN